ncbi:hotdog fold thioesterase [bacterium]|nr:hotdog fold thioesterase [bacterium]
MDALLRESLIIAVQREQFSNLLKIKLLDLDTGYALVEMAYEPAAMNNIYERAHGGAIFSLIDEAFQVAGQTYGSIAVALNVNVTYIASPEPGSILRAEATAVSTTKRTGTFEIRVTDESGRLIALCQALGFRTGKPIPFLQA